ncbi:MAG TPA: HTTM domain-containing protein [Acidimicrobiia bacterium]|nr:HTTM domain-containing protein [Acidimicrobiia bacterium]
MIRRLDTLLARTGSLRAVALLRIAIGPIVLLHLQPFLVDSLDGRIPGDTFVVPFAGWYPILPRAAYLTALWATVGTAVLLSLGLLTRAAAVFTAGFVAYNLFLSQTHFHHNRAFLVILLTGLALLRVGDHLSIDAWWRRRRRRTPGPAPLWPLWLMRFEVAVVYAASGFSKLIDPDWFGGTVLLLRIEQWRDTALDRGAPGWALDLLADPGFMSGFAKVVVLSELFIGLGLLWPRTRLVAVWVAIPFHLAIEATASVQTFSVAALAALTIWVTPRDHDRTLAVPADTRLHRLVRRLDWTGRFDVSDGPLILDDRGITRTGADALLAVLARLPLTFWFAAPARLIRRP